MSDLEVHSASTQSSGTNEDDTHEGQTEVVSPRKDGHTSPKASGKSKSGINICAY